MKMHTRLLKVLVGVSVLWVLAILGLFLFLPSEPKRPKGCGVRCLGNAKSIAKMMRTYAIDWGRDGSHPPSYGMAFLAWYTTTPHALFNALKTMPEIDLSAPVCQAAQLNVNSVLFKASINGISWEWRSDFRSNGGICMRGSSPGSGDLSYDTSDWGWLTARWTDGNGKMRVLVGDGHEVPTNCVLRWQGDFKFPGTDAGAWSQVRLRGDWSPADAGWLWFDTNGNKTIEPSETLADQTLVLEAEGTYRVVVLWHNERSEQGSVRVRWRKERDGETADWKFLAYDQCLPLVVRP